MDVSRGRFTCRQYCMLIVSVVVMLGIIAVLTLPTVILKGNKIREPTLTINSVSVDEPASFNGSFLPMMVATIDASVDTSILVLQFKNITAYYHNRQVGQTEFSPGVAPARGTIRMKAKLNLNITKLRDNPQFVHQLMKLGSIKLNTSISVGGKVKLHGVISHHVDILYNCTLSINATSFSLKNQTCSPHMWLT